MNQPHSQLSEQEAQQLMRSLLQKEGNWVDWGKACQKLQQGGYNSQNIFEETGFQGSQQNTIIVAAQVYDSVVAGGASEELKSYLKGPHSDILYELRILNQEQRSAVAELARDKRLDFDEARYAAKAVKEFSLRFQLPEGFSRHPGDAVAYQCWKRARQKRDLQDRSRLIAQGLKFAHTQGAREQIERLLSDFTVVPTRSAPVLPIYRLESEEELPRIIPVVGVMPITVEDLQAVPQLKQTEPFRVVQPAGKSTLVPIPGWQVVLKAADPVGFFCNSDDLPQSLPNKPEQVLVVVDRENTQWDINSYFALEKEGQVKLQWSETAPDSNILGQVVLVLRPKRIIDENIITEPWQMDD
ncbi:MAG: RuBisCO accumulation factor 1 [Spirulinaceae cyanobacterium]